MRALLSIATGGPETLVMGELPEPIAGPGQVVVAIKACSINFPDTLQIVDLYQFKPPRPFAPGGEVAGVVEAVGEGVSGFAVGDRVIGLCGNGGLTREGRGRRVQLFQNARCDVVRRRRIVADDLWHLDPCAERSRPHERGR